jgi:hypothetical protein
MLPPLHNGHAAKETRDRAGTVVAPVGTPYVTLGANGCGSLAITSPGNDRMAVVVEKSRRGLESASFHDRPDRVCAQATILAKKLLACKRLSPHRATFAIAQLSRGSGP